MPTIFVSHASDCLTDHLPHGEGLLSFTWLKTLAERGYKVYAYSPYADIKTPVKNLIVFKKKGKSLFSFFPSLAYWDFAYESGKILKNILKQENVDLVWRMYPYQASAPMIDTMGKPLVVGPLYSSYNKDNIFSNHPFGFKPSKIGTYFGSKSWAKMLRKADLLFTDDTKLAKELSLIFSKKEISQLPAIIKPTIQVRKRETPNFSKEIKLAFLGHFKPVKRMPEFCKIIHALQEKGYNAIGYIMGKGPDHEIAIDLCMKLGITDKVNFLGVVPNSEVYNILSEMHFLINLREETYGRNMIEAMSVGTPNICVNKFAAKEFLEHGTTGILLDDIKFTSYVDKIETIINQPEYWQYLSNNSLIKSQEWGPDKIFSILDVMFKKTVRNKVQIENSGL